jgi:hypothetical protein
MWIDLFGTHRLYEALVAASGALSVALRNTGNNRPSVTSPIRSAMTFRHVPHGARRGKGCENLPKGLDERSAVQRRKPLCLAAPLHESAEVLPSFYRQPPVLDHASR